MERKKELTEKIKKIEESLEPLKKELNEYYNRESPHYQDNERFSWAVKTINEGRINDIAELEEMQKKE